MSSQIGDAYTMMTQDMSYKLAGYMTSLEHRYGDPRMYEMQREEMAAEQAEVVHRQVKTTEEALSAAYQKNRQRARDNHASRMARYAQDRPPQYLEPDDQHPSSQPPDAGSSRQPAKGRARSRASAR